MKATLKQKPVEVFTMSDMKCGQLAVITDSGSGHKGDIIQRYKDIFITIGEDSGSSYPSSTTSRTKVKLLVPGDIIELGEDEEQDQYDCY